jgi:hypothetical protein
MQNAKRMVLVDERLLDSLQHFRDKRDQSWKQPTEESVKTSISRGLKSTLEDSDLPDDVKAKQYSHNLQRFLQTKRKQPDIGDLFDFTWKSEADEKPTLPDVKPPSLKKRRTSTRFKKKPQRFEWEEW